MTSLLQIYEIPVFQAEDFASKFQKLCVFSGLNTGSEDYFEMSKAVDRTEKAVHRLEKEVRDVKTEIREMKDMISAISTHLCVPRP